MPPRVHLLIPTHVCRHLGPCLASIALQTRPPETVVLTTDGHGMDGSIAELVDALWPRVARALRGAGRPVPTLLHASRDHQGEPRVNQVRNNGLRALDGHGVLSDEDLVVILDGDTCMEPGTLAGHRRLCEQGADLIIPYRYDLTEAQTARVDVETLLDQERGAALLRSLPTPAQENALRARHRRYERQRLARDLGLGRLGLLKAHKPKTLGGQHAVRVRALRAVNGYDERFMGHGFDDDELGRRLHALRPRVRTRIAVRELPVHHLYHPTRRDYAVHESADYPVFCAPWRVEAEFGWQNPTAQSPEVVVRVVDAG